MKNNGKMCIFSIKIYILFKITLKLIKMISKIKYILLNLHNLAGSNKQEAGSSKQEAASRKQKIGSRK